MRHRGTTETSRGDGDTALHITRDLTLPFMPQFLAMELRPCFYDPVKGRPSALPARVRQGEFPRVLSAAVLDAHGQLVKLPRRTTLVLHIKNPQGRVRTKPNRTAQKKGHFTWCNMQLSLTEPGTYSLSVALQRQSPRDKQQVTVDAISSRGRTTTKTSVRDTAYNQRKDRENGEFCADVMEHTQARTLEDTRCLVLDDYRKASKASPIPNTTQYLLKIGVLARNIVVPNPDIHVINGVQKAGAQGYRMTANTLLRRAREFQLPRLDGIYLDYKGTFATYQDDLEELFRQHTRLLQDKAVIHITSCRRGCSEHPALTILGLATEWAAKYHYGVVSLKWPRVPTSSTMYKTILLLTRSTTTTRAS